MSRDYKHKQTPPDPHAPGWVWLVVGLVIGLSVTVVLHIRSQRQQILQPAPAVDTRDADTAISDDDSNDYTFYDLLPSFEVVVPEPADVAADGDATTAISEPGTYVIQVGSFREFEDADRRKAELAFMGIESRIHKVTIDEDQTYHRVRIGPIDELGRLNQLREQLRAAEIETLVLKGE